MEFLANNNVWKIKLVNPTDKRLYRSDGSLSVATTDNIQKCIFISWYVSGAFLRKVICHELCHVFCFENHLHLSIEFEEILADFIASYGKSIVDTADMLFRMIEKVA